MMFFKKPRFFALLLMVSFVLLIFSPVTVIADTKLASPVNPGLSISNIQGQPASFQKVSFTVREGVILVDNKLGNAFQNNLKLYDELAKPNFKSDILPKDKLKLRALVKKSELSSICSNYKKGTVLFDKTNNLAIKVIDNISLGNSADSEYVSMSMPQVHEVLSDFCIPKQSVKLVKGNITGFAPGVEESVNTSNTKDDDSVLSDNPFIKFTFDPDKPLVAYDENGVKFEVKVEGHFGIDSITADGYYSFSDGYQFVLKTAEELKLKVTCAASLKEGKKIVVPLFGVTVPALIGNVTGAIALVVGADGSMELEATAHQWLTAEAGLEGGTCLGIPTGFHVIKNIDKDFEIDVTFEGKINGFVKAGPMLDIEILGRNMAGAGLFVGLGARCEYKAGDKLTADIYGLLEVYASILGNKKTLVDEKIVLYQLTKQNTSNYVIRFNEACMYRNTIWGNIKILGTGTPVTGPAIITVENKAGRKTAIDVNCDSSGNFRANVNLEKGLQLAKEDKIYVSSVNGHELTSEPISPTFPFKEISLDYADFFNDSSTGHVSPAKVMNWDTNKLEYLYYTGNVNYSIAGTTSPGKSNQGIRNLAASKPISQTVKCDAEGNFTLKYDFKPGNKAIVALNFNGVNIKSGTVKSDTEIAGRYLTELTGKKEYNENGRLVEQKTETDHFFLYNLRGSKAVTQAGNLSVGYDYYNSSLCCVIDTTLRHALMPPQKLKSVELTQALIPVYTYKASKSSKEGASNIILSSSRIQASAVIIPTGGSEASRQFVTEWSWGGNASQPVIKLDTPSNDKPVVLRYEANEQKPETGARTGQGVDYIQRAGLLKIYYEGVVIADVEFAQDNIDYGVIDSNKKTGMNPVMRVIVDKIQSRINPATLQKVTDRVGNSAATAR